MFYTAASVAVVLGGLFGPAGGAPSPSASSYALFETHRAPSSFRRIGDAPRSHTITLRIGLRQPRMSELETIAYAVSDPTHERYGAHLTEDEVETVTAPHAHSVDAVAAWLESHGLTGDFSKAKEWVVVPDVDISKAEKMLDTKYGVFQHEDGEHLVRTESYSLPVDLHQHIDLIQPTNMFGRLTAQRSTIAKVEHLDEDQTARIFSSVASIAADLYHGVIGGATDEQAANKAPAACTNPKEVTSACLRQLYNTYDYVPKATQKNSIALTGYLGEYAQFSDLAMFLKSQRPDQANFKFTVIGPNPQGLNSSQTSNNKGLEADLDVQTAAGITAPTPNIFYSTPGSPPFVPDQATPSNTNEPYLDWLQNIQSLSDADIPKVVSSSYDDDEQSVPPSYAQKACSGFAQLGARGVSLLFSSGDNGVGNNGKCYTNDGKNKKTFLPYFPSTCPFVTSVGATQYFAPEEAVSSGGPGGYYGGGGFSSYFSPPSYQASDVGPYVKSLGNKYQGLYNNTGRGYPDVAAQGASYLIAYNHAFTHVGGTSAAAPTFASVITLLNDYRLSQGKPVLGFLNPWLYQTGRQGLNDITKGSSAGCNTNGFPAQKGWDAVTGLGTPDFKKLQQLLP